MKQDREVSKGDDPVDRALELLRREHGPVLPDPALEARLMARHATRRAAPSRWRNPWTVAALTAFAGASFAAAGGVDWLRSWWYRVEVDGRSIEGVVDGEGGRAFEVDTADGGKAFVRVHRDRVGGASRTRIGIERVNAGGVEIEESEDVIGGPPGERLPVAVIAGARAFYNGMDPSGGHVELYVASDEAGGSRLFVARPDEDAEHVLELARLPFEVLSDGVQVEITERADGALLLEFTYALRADREGAAVFALVIPGPVAAPPPTSRLQTTDGAIRVEVENPPLEDPHRNEER